MSALNREEVERLREAINYQIAHHFVLGVFVGGVLGLMVGLAITGGGR